MSASSYSGPERRQTPRISIEAVAYIGFESNNGGIVLNVSEGGLRFCAIAPITASETVRFWFTAEGYRVDAEGEVTWVDESQKRGGLCFKVLPPHARDPIRKWIYEPTPALAAEGKSSIHRPLAANQADKATVLEILNPVNQRIQNKKVAMRDVLSRGLVSGLVVSALLGAAILFYMDRRHFGEALIQIGQQLAAKPPAHTVPRPAAPIPFPLPEELSSPPSGETIYGKQARVTLSKPAVGISGISPEISLPMSDRPRGRSLLPAEPENFSLNAPVPEVDLEHSRTDAAEDAPNADVISTSKRYLDVSEFRQEAAADQSRDSLAQLGFPASVSHTGHLWMSSYHVLVGPYTNDEDVEKARNELESRGFHLPPGARQSRKFVLPLLTLAGTTTVVRDGVISWDSNSSAGTVAFLNAGNVVSKAQGRWVKRGTTYKLDAVVSGSSGRGPQTLVEIQCHGMNQAFVFDESNPVRYFVPPFGSFNR